MSKSTWVIDPTHSHIGFKVKHLMITTVSGEFTRYSATVQADDDRFSGLEAAFSAEAASVTTHN
jgi:polyisoprenoid-binding protein YceI